MKVFPLSPELRSGKCYACGVDVCEEGIQFCNTHERRCEYCTDHHQDCFTYAQQQNCTQYCQDQWRKTLLDNCTVCEAIECEEFPASLIPGKIYLFFADVCREGLQFCNADIRERRCEFCDAYFHNCFTYQQQPNCTQYCMDQWIQNSRFNIAAKETGNDKYKIAFFTLIGLCVTIIVIITVCSCIPCFREWICSQISKFFKSSATNNHFQGLRSGTAAPFLPTFPGGQHRNPLSTASGASVINNGIPVTSPAVAQPHLPNNHRPEADGISHHGRSESEEANPHRRRTASQQRADASTSSALRGDEVPPAQVLTKSKSKSAASASETKYDNRVKAREEESIPFLKNVPNGSLRGKIFNDNSVTYAKNLIRRQSDDNERNQSDDNERNHSPHHELSNLHSSGYRALPPVYSASADTGYDSASAGQGSRR
ncbi:uncharacterized protein LOC123564901 isoform X2 [Mercenaria mercenaria]|uniref:uncharacterized protein LOC123564901 isoform X2 n=1 Tax=Mercenaria mercenaria TaxID=6596 RepID=UPI00234E8367|nr:uncharacterized protein LOC123564901 isoform X2 [Mercenaria mercenaria]